MLSVRSEELGRQFQSDFGDRFWAMAQSGLQKESLDANEAQQRDEIQQWLRQTFNKAFIKMEEFNVSQQRSCSASRSSVRLADPDSNLPAGSWTATSATALWHKSEI